MRNALVVARKDLDCHTILVERVQHLGHSGHGRIDKGQKPRPQGP
jgi:hypothetical protein